VACVAKLPKWAIKQAGGINKKAWRLAKSRRRKTSSKPRRRSSPRRRTKSHNPRRSMPRKMLVPHPSITGMAAGFTILDDLNKGAGARTGVFGSGTVFDNALKGSFNNALLLLSSNAQNMVKTPTGRTSLLQAVGIAALGSWARRALPATKIGGTKLYFRI